MKRNDMKKPQGRKTNWSGEHFKMMEASARNENEKNGIWGKAPEMNELCS